MLNGASSFPRTIPPGRSLARIADIPEQGAAVQNATQGTPISATILAANQRNASVNKHVIFAPVSATASSRPFSKFSGIAIRKSSTASKGLPGKAPRPPRDCPKTRAPRRRRRPRCKA